MKFFVRGLGIAEGTRDVIAETEDLRFTIYDLRFGAEGTTKARRHEGAEGSQNAETRVQKLEVAEEWRLANSEWRIANGGSPALATAAAVAAIGDRGVAAMAAPSSFAKGGAGDINMGAAVPAAIATSAGETRASAFAVLPEEITTKSPRHEGSVIAVRQQKTSRRGAKAQRGSEVRMQRPEGRSSLILET